MKRRAGSSGWALGGGGDAMGETGRLLSLLLARRAEDSERRPFQVLEGNLALATEAVAVHSTDVQIDGPIETNEKVFSRLEIGVQPFDIFQPCAAGTDVLKERS